MNGAYSRLSSQPFALRSWVQLAAVACTFVLAAWSKDAHAYAWMINQGYAKCGSCHVDPSGGELLTHMGRVFSENDMSTKWSDSTPSDLSKFVFGLDEPDAVRLGGSFRGMRTQPLGDGEAAIFPMQADLYGAVDFGAVQLGVSLGVAGVTANTAYNRAAQLTSVDEADLIDENGESQRAMAVLSRWHWLGFELSDTMLLRLGRMNLPFGLRTSEHTLWARASTATDRESDQQHGIALAHSGGAWRYEFMLSLGNFQIGPDDFRERGYSGTFEYMVDSDLALGISSSILRAGKSLVTGSQEATLRHAHGITARWAPWGPATILAEADIIKRTGSTLGYTGFLTADFAVIQGLHLAASAEWLSTGKTQGGTAIAGAGKPQLGYWLTAHWLVFTHVDARVDLVMREDPITETLNKQLLTQLHLYL
jgi:hypothetical protein